MHGLYIQYRPVLSRTVAKELGAGLGRLKGLYAFDPSIREAGIC